MRKSIDEQIRELELKKKRLLKKKVLKNKGTFYKIGELVEEYYLKSFEGFSVDKFVQEVNEIKGVLIEKPAVSVVIPASVSPLV